MLRRSMKFWCFSMMIVAGVLGFGLVFSGLEPVAAPEAEPSIQSNPADIDQEWLSGVKEYIAEDERKIRRHTSGVLVANTQRGFRGFFSQRGILVVPSGTAVGKENQAAWRWDFVLLGVGRLDRLNKLEREGPTFEGHKVSYDLGRNVREIWENREDGLKQSVFIDKRPGGRGRVVLEGRWGGDVQMRGDRSGVVMSSGGMEVLRFAGLVVRDARGAILPSGMGHSGQRLLLWYRDRDAVYPVELDPILTSPGWSSVGDDQGSCSYSWGAGTAGDVNGDGYSDIIVGAPLFDTTNQDAGKAYIYHGGASGPSLTPDWESSGEDQADAKFGQGAATAGDVDGDGFSDVIVSAWYYDSAGTNNGKAYMYLGGSSGVQNTPDWSSSGDDNQDNAYYGVILAPAGDVNGDGYSDIIVGAYGQAGLNPGAGKAYVYHGGPGGLSLTADWTSSGDDQLNAGVGLGVASAGDVNGDGFSDVIVGSGGYDTATHTDAGRVYVFHGGPGGLSLAADWTSSGDDDQDGVFFGMIASTAGDVNGDGYSDVIVGAYSTDTPNVRAGEAFVFQGSSGGLLDTPIWKSSGDDIAGADYGRYVSTAGDVNGDGYADIIVGARMQDTPTVQAGKAFVYEGGPSGPSLTPDWTSSGDDQSGAGFGQTVATAGDVNGDGFSDILIGANYFTTANGSVGKAYVYYGSGSGLSTTHDWDRLGSGNFGWSVSEAGDVNGDGYSDVIVGADMFSTTHQWAGRAYVFLGGPSGLSTFWNWDSSGDDNQASAFYGKNVSTAGDVNGDGYSDIIVSAPGFDTTVSGEGKAYVYRGGPSGVSTTPSWTSSGDNQDGAGYGSGVSTAGDVDGDGYSDVIVGASSFDASGAATGKAYVYLGSTSGLSLTADWSSIGEDQAGAGFGGGVDTAGDVDGDGYSDVIIGAPGYDASNLDTGKAYVFHGGPSGLSLTPDWESVGEDKDDALFGSCVGTAGDVDGDGYSDVVIGARGYDTSGDNNQGKAYLYHGGGGGLALTEGWSSIGDDYPGAAFGISVSTAGDVNGDGYSDIIAGAPSFDGSALDTGKAYLFLGSGSGVDLTPAWTSLGNDVLNGRFGKSVSTAGDVNGDGFSDVIVGAFGGGEERAFVYHGGGGGDGFYVAPRQARADGSALVQLLGLSGAADQVRLRLLAHTAAGRTRARLIWEVKPFGTPFDYTGFGVGPWVDTGVAGTEYDQLVSGLVDNTQYHWRVRLQYLPHMNYSMWYSIGPNGPEEADFRTGVISGCVLHTECPPCQECVTGTCQDQAVGSDIKNECTADDCNTGDCDGMGLCGFVGAGAPCGDQGVVCHINDTCDGNGGCTDNGFEADGVSCDDGLYCNGTDTCNAAGACQHTGSPCTGAECDDAVCNDTTDDCYQPAGTVCTDSTPDDCYTAACSGTGVCLQNYNIKAEGLPCDDGLYCTETDACNAVGGCIGTGDPCALGGPCNRTCNEGPQNCFDPDGTSCDNGIYCDGTDTCDASGNCISSGDPCTGGPECNDTCDEGDKDCFSDPGASCGSSSSDQCDNPDGCDGAGTCLSNNVTNDTPCDDSDPCSDLDTCQSGFCQAGPDNKDTDLDTYIDEVCGGDDCNDSDENINIAAAEVCDDTIDNDCDTMTDMVDPECMECTTDPECDDSNECTNDACVANACQNVPVIDGTPCDDGQYCTEVDTCQGGSCGGTQRDCSGEADQCNDGVCNDFQDQCEAVPVTEGTLCDDGLYCTMGDNCAGGLCQSGAGRDCSSFTDECNQGACDESGDVCYPDPAPREGQACDDLQYCTVGETCQTGSCIGGIARDCSGMDDQCNVGTCDEGGDVCYPNSVPREGQVCDDLLYCTLGELCVSGSCQGVVRDCTSFDDQCNVGACNEGTDTCYADTGPREGANCDDSDPCTMNDTCASGVCFGPPLDVDGDGFTSDACSGNDCDDGNFDVNPGIFEGPAGDPICGDGIDNDCDTLTDLAESTCGTCIDNTDCDDNDVCNGLETCLVGNCQAGTALDCNDNEFCTTDSCDPVGGCQNSPNSNPCNDNDPCTTVDRCNGGTCQGTGYPCDFDPCRNVCTPQGPGYTCDPTPNVPAVSCDDADPCTENDVCVDGSCQGAVKDCSQGVTDECYEGYCESGTGACRQRPEADGTACDDGEFCTDRDECVGGSCVGQPRDCSVLTDQCNQGVCDETADSCVAQPLTDGDSCNDGEYCTVGDVCTGGSCGGVARDCSRIGDACNLAVCNESDNRCETQPVGEGEHCAVCRICQDGRCLAQEGIVCKGCYVCEDGSGRTCARIGNVSTEDTCDGGLCLLEGRCGLRERCVIEGFCDVEAAGCGRAAVLYGTEDTQTLNCRLGGEKVDVGVEVEPVPGGEGTFVPVRLVLGNTDAGSWTKGLHEIRVIVRLNPGTMPGGKIAYVIGSAILQGGEKYVEEDINETEKRVVFRLFDPMDPEDTQMMPAPDEGDWALDFVLMRGENAEGVFQVDVWAPCESMNEDVGCHYEYEESDLYLDELIGNVQLQRISKPKYVSTSGKVTDNPNDPEIIDKLLQSPVMGCQCHAFYGPGSSQGGTQGRGGWGWLVLLLIAAVLRKYRV